MFALESKDMDLPLYSNGAYEKLPTGTFQKAPSDTYERKLSGGSSTVTLSDSKTSERQNEKLGIFFSLLTPFVFVLSSTIGRLVPDVPPIQLIFMRAVTTVLPFYALLHYANKFAELKANLKNYKLHLNSFFATMSALVFYIALFKLSMSETFTIYSTVGILNGLLGSLILKDPYTRREKILGVISFVGVVLIIRPPFIFGSEEEDADTDSSTSMSHAAAGFYAFLSALTFSLYQIGVRASRSNVDPYVSAFYTHIGTAIWIGLYFLLFGEFKPMGSSQYFGCFLFGVSTIGGFVAVSFALKYATPSVVGLLGYAQLVFSLLVDVLIFADFPSLLTICGGTLIVGSCLYLVMKKREA